MPAPNLTPEQIELWKELYPHIVSGNKKALQRQIIQLAVHVIEEQPDTDKIMVSRQKLISFPTGRYPAKEAYVTALRISANSDRTVALGADWAEDAALYSILEALGYNAQLNIIKREVTPTGIKTSKAKGLDYNVIQQQQKDSGVSKEIDRGLQIDIVNEVNMNTTTGYESGFHWRLAKGPDTTHDGNCGWDMIRQQLISDAARVAAAYPEIVPAKLVKKSVTEVSPYHSKTVSGANVARLPQDEISKIEADFEKIELNDAQREQDALKRLQTQSLKDLITIYDRAKTLAGGDSWLLKSYKNVDNADLKERLSDAIDSHDYDPDDKDVKANVIRILAKEAWRNPKAYEYFVKETGGAAKTRLQSVDPKTDADERDTPFLSF